MYASGTKVSLIFALIIKFGHEVNLRCWHVCLCGHVVIKNSAEDQRRTCWNGFKPKEFCKKKNCLNLHEMNRCHYLMMSKLWTAQVGPAPDPIKYHASFILQK